MIAPQQQQYHEEECSSESDAGGCCGEEGPTKHAGPIGEAPPYIRRGFIRKVYSILSFQLLLTAAIAAPIHMYLTPEFVATHMSLYYLCMFGTVGLLLGMACCCQQAARTFPTNYILLLSFTVLQSIMIGFFATLYTSTSVLLAVAATAMVFGGLTAYACCTKTDFTGMGPYLVTALLCLVCFMSVISIASWFTVIPTGLMKVYSGCGVLLFSFYIVYDTQMIMGGTHEQQFSVDDYCFAALNLYLDIVNMFMYLLSLFGDRR